MFVSSGVGRCVVTERQRQQCACDGAHAMSDARACVRRKEVAARQQTSGKHGIYKDRPTHGFDEPEDPPRHAASLKS